MIKPQKLTKKQALFVLLSSICIISFFVIAFISSEPKITVNGSDHIYLGVGEDYVETGAQAADADGNLLPVKITGNVNSDKAGDVEIVYSATHLGRTVQATRTVTVVETEAGK